MRPLTFLLAFTLSLVNLRAIPISATPPADLMGTIDSFVWIKKTYFEYEGDDILLSMSSDVARYLIIIKTNSLDKRTRQSLSFYAHLDGATGLSHAISMVELEDDEMMIRIASPKIKGMKQGAKIEVTGYSLSGDELGTGETFTELKLDGKSVEIPEAKSGNAAKPAAAATPQKKAE